MKHLLSIKQYWNLDRDTSIWNNTTESPSGATFIGYSLSLCVADILDWVRREEEVKKIRSSTAFESRERMLIELERYKRIYWLEKPEECANLAIKFWDEGKIEQPRIKNPQYFRRIGKTLSSRWKKV